MGIQSATCGYGSEYRDPWYLTHNIQLLIGRSPRAGCEITRKCSIGKRAIPQSSRNTVSGAGSGVRVGWPHIPGRCIGQRSCVADVYPL